MVKKIRQCVKFLNLLPLSSGIGLRLQQEVNKVDVGVVITSHSYLIRTLQILVVKAATSVFTTSLKKIR